MSYWDFRRNHTSTNILNVDEEPHTKDPISRVKSTQPQGKVRVVPYDASKPKKAVDTPSEKRYKTPLTSQGTVRVIPDKSTPAPAPKAAAPAPKAAAPTPRASAPAPKATVSAPKAATHAPKPRPNVETDASRAARQAAYNDWKTSNAEPMAKLASETSGKAGYQGLKKGGSIDGIAKSGKTRGRYI